MTKCSECGRNKLAPAKERGPGVDGIVDYDTAASMALGRAADILVNEFSYDGEDRGGVKAYQDDVNYFTALARKLRGE